LTPLEKELKQNRECVEALEPGDTSEDARKSITSLGAAYRALGMWEEALRTFDTGLSRAEEAEDPEATSRFLISRSCTFYHMGQYARAIEFATRAIKSRISDVSRAKYISYYLANPYEMLGDMKRYVALQEEAVNLTESFSYQQEQEHLPWILCRLAKGWDMMGYSHRANPVLVDHVAIFRNMNHRFGMPFSMLLLGRNLLNLDRPQESEQFLTEALVLYEENGQEGLLVDTVVALSEAAAAMKNMEEARLYADQAVEEARRGPRRAEGLADKRHLNQALIQSARIYLELGRKHESLVLYGEALEMAARSNRRLMLAELLELQKALIHPTPSVPGINF